MAPDSEVVSCTVNSSSGSTLPTSPLHGRAKTDSSIRGHLILRPIGEEMQQSAWRRNVMASHVFCPVLCPVLSCPVMFSVLSPVLSCHVLCPVLSPVKSPVLSPVLSSVLSCPLSCTLSCPLSCLVPCPMSHVPCLCPASVHCPLSRVLSSVLYPVLLSCALPYLSGRSRGRARIQPSVH